MQIPVIALLSIHPKELKTDTETIHVLPMSIAALFLILKDGDCPTGHMYECKQMVINKDL